MTPEPDPKSPSPVALYGAFFGCALVWGSTFLAISIGNDTVPPYWAVTLRLGLATVILIAMGFFARQPFPRGAALRAAAVYGLFEFGFSLPLLYWSEKSLPSGLAAVIYATIPLTSTLLARMLGLERLTLLKVTAASVATIGVAVIFAGQMTAAVSIWPMIGLVTATICGAFGALMLKRGPRQPSLFANGIGSAVGLVVGLTVSLIAREPHEIPRRMDQIGPILYLTIASSVVAFGLFAWLVNHWDVTRISFVSVITPIVALTLGAIVRHEPLSAASLLGSALVIVGVVLRIQADRGPTRARAAGG